MAKASEALGTSENEELEICSDDEEDDISIYEHGKSNSRNSGSLVPRRAFSSK